jgi:hypothetical protein
MSCVRHLALIAYSFTEMKRTVGLQVTLVNYFVVQGNNGTRTNIDFGGGEKLGMSSRNTEKTQKDE